MDTKCSICKTQAPKVQCNCRDPSLVLCEVCLASHIVSQLSVRHSTQQIVHQQPQKQKLVKCSVCQNHQAQIICLCKGEKTRLCHGCIPFHMSKHPRSPHPMQQLQADQIIGQTNQSLLNYLQRKQVVDYLVGEARQNLVQITKFRQQTIAAYQKIQQFIHQNLLSKLAHIKEVEINIDQLITHIQAVRYETHLNDFDWAHLLVKKANPSNLSLVAQQLNMLKTEINLNQALESIRYLSVFQIQRDPQQNSPSIPYFKAKKQEMFLYETCTSSSSKSSVPGLNMKQVAGWCSLPSGQIFYCGGCEQNEYSKEAYLIDFYFNSCQKLPDMIHSRAFPSLFYSNSCVFVFGGYTGSSIKQAEKFDLIRKAWVRLPDMPSSRSAFTIVEYKNKLFLAGDSQEIDCYDMVNNSYSQIEFPLTETGSYLTLAKVEERILVFQSDKCWEWDLEENKAEVLCGIPNGKWWSHFPCIVNGSVVYFSRYDDYSLWSLSLERLELARLWRF